MENKMMHINCEKDLEFYEKNLTQMPYNETLQHKGDFAKHLTGCIGKWVMVETCSGRCMSKKVGKLLEVGEDYIVIKMSEDCVSTIIPKQNINFITVAHKNTAKMMMK